MFFSKKTHMANNDGKSLMATMEKSRSFCASKFGMSFMSELMRMSVASKTFAMSEVFPYCFPIHEG